MSSFPDQASVEHLIELSHKFAQVYTARVKLEDILKSFPRSRDELNFIFEKLILDKDNGNNNISSSSNSINDGGSGGSGWTYRPREEAKPYCSNLKLKFRSLIDPKDTIRFTFTHLYISPLELAPRNTTHMVHYVQFHFLMTRKNEQQQQQKQQQKEDNDLIEIPVVIPLQSEYVTINYTNEARDSIVPQEFVKPQHYLTSSPSIASTLITELMYLKILDESFKQYRQSPRYQANVFIEHVKNEDDLNYLIAHPLWSDIHRPFMKKLLGSSFNATFWCNMLPVRYEEEYSRWVWSHRVCFMAHDAKPITIGSDPSKDKYTLAKLSFLGDRHLSMHFRHCTDSNMYMTITAGSSGHSAEHNFFNSNDMISQTLLQQPSNNSLTWVVTLTLQDTTLGEAIDVASKFKLSKLGMWTIVNIMKVTPVLWADYSHSSFILSTLGTAHISFTVVVSSGAANALRTLDCSCYFKSRQDQAFSFEYFKNGYLLPKNTFTCDILSYQNMKRSMNSKLVNGKVIHKQFPWLYPEIFADTKMILATHEINVYSKSITLYRDAAHSDKLVTLPIIYQKRLEIATRPFQLKIWSMATQTAVATLTDVGIECAS